MARTYYAQSEKPDPTMTVGQLIEALQTFNPNDPVIFRTPLYGTFGSNTAYTIDAVDWQQLGRREVHTPAEIVTDDETGEEWEREAETQVFNAWSGVVIS